MTSAARIQLLGGLIVASRTGHAWVPEGSKRLVAYCALHRSATERRRVARTLWPDVDDTRAAGNLRSALWRLRGADIDVLECSKSTIRLREDVVVDVDEMIAWAERLESGIADGDDLRLPPWSYAALDILPGWYDDWALIAREHIRHLMLRGLVRLATELCRVGRGAAAVEVAMVAATEDRLSEEAHAALIRAHLADGNHVMAWRTYCRFRTALDQELGVEPNPTLTSFIMRSLRTEVPDAPSRLVAARPA